MAARPSLFADGHQTVHRAGDGSAHEQKIALNVDLDDTQADLGEIARAHVPGHPLTLDDARRVGTRRDRSRLAMPRVAVRLGTAAEMMTMHDALEAATLRHTADLHPIAFGENGDGDGGSGSRGLARDGEASNDARRGLDPALFDVAGERLRRPLRL